MTTTTLATADTLTPQQIEAYRRDGFVQVSNLLSAEQVARLRDGAVACQERLRSHAEDYGASVFNQYVNVWKQDAVLRELTLAANMAGIAEELSGGPLRVWHDQVLIKKPHNQAPTVFHQDQPYWPVEGATRAISCWVALCDVPMERGCMSFIRGAHHRSDLAGVPLGEGQTLFDFAPDLEYEQRVTIPLRAGDCTFHHGLTPHMANANETDEPRVAMAVIYLDAETRFTGGGHTATQGVEAAKAGEILPDTDFPTTRSIREGTAESAWLSAQPQAAKE
jgi:phytanoyl-CoA hydroxylase